MYRILKWAFDLGYKFAERHYYQKLIMQSRSRGEQDLIFMDITDKERRSYVEAQVDFEKKFQIVVNNVFTKYKRVDHEVKPVLPFDEEVKE